MTPLKDSENGNPAALSWWSASEHRGGDRIPDSSCMPRGAARRSDGLVRQQPAIFDVGGDLPAARDLQAAPGLLQSGVVRGGSERVHPRLSQPLAGGAVT